VGVYILFISGGVIIFWLVQEVNSSCKLQRNINHSLLWTIVRAYTATSLVSRCTVGVQICWSIGELGIFRGFAEGSRKWPRVRRARMAR